MFPLDSRRLEYLLTWSIFYTAHFYMLEVSVPDINLFYTHNQYNHIHLAICSSGKSSVSKAAGVGLRIESWISQKNSRFIVSSTGCYLEKKKRPNLDSTRKIKSGYNHVYWRLLDRFFWDWIIPSLFTGSLYQNGDVLFLLGFQQSYPH